MNNIRRLAFIGGGNMAAALIGGLTKRGLPRERIVVADPSREQLERLTRDYGVTAAADNLDAVAGAEVVVLAVKPQQMRAVALGLAPHLAETNPHHAEPARAQRLRRYGAVRTGERRRRQPRSG